MIDGLRSRDWVFHKVKEPMKRRGEYDGGYEASSESEDEWDEFSRRQFISWKESKYLLKIAGNSLLAIISIPDESGDSDVTNKYFSDEDDACAEGSGGLRLTSE